MIFYKKIYQMTSNVTPEVGPLDELLGAVGAAVPWPGVDLKMRTVGVWSLKIRKRKVLADCIKKILVRTQLLQLEYPPDRHCMHMIEQNERKQCR